MDAMSLPASPTIDFDRLLQQVSRDFPSVRFRQSDTFRWSAEAKAVYYAPQADYAGWSLLHELGHVIAEHNSYRSDARLIRLEVEAWDTAVKLAADYGFAIDPDHIQDSLDSYRNWQYKRSICPVCALSGVEQADGRYHCVNCRHKWRVTTNRFCRVYRRSG
jgi:hypothetical protein